jgi:hypothetical protein
MIMTSSNILPTFQDGDAYLECILKKGEHDFTTIDSTPRQISRNVYEIHVICVDCGYADYKYNILEDENFDL